MLRNMLYTIAGIILPITVLSGELQTAVEQGDEGRVRSILTADPAQAKVAQQDGTTLLHQAAVLNNAGIVKLLIAGGADTGAKTSGGWTPLHSAAAQNATNSITVLLAAGADLKAVTADGLTPLQLAVRGGRNEAARQLTVAPGGGYSEQFIEVSFEAGQKALDSGDLEKAYKVFTKLVKDEPSNMKVRFVYGMTCFAMKDYPRAQMAFEEVVRVDPGNDRARFELGRTYFAREQLELARQEFDTIMARKPREAVRKQIERYLGEIDRAARRWTFGARVDAGWISDDNVNVGPGFGVIRISPVSYGSEIIDSLSIDESSRPRKAQGYFSSISLLSAYDAGSPGDWIIGADGAYYQNWFSDAKSNESRFAALAVGPRYSWQSGLVNLPLSVSQINYGGKPLLNMYGFAPSLMFSGSGTRDWLWVTSCNAELRDYDTLNDRDGNYLAVGETVKHLFGGGRHTVFMGVDIFRENAKAGMYSNSGRSWNAGAELSLPYDTFFYLKLRHTTTSYSERETLAPDVRADTQRQFSFGLAGKVFEKFGLDASYQITQNTSSFPLYQYDRNVATVSASYSF